MKNLKDEPALRITYSDIDGFWLLIKTASGKEAGINLPSMNVYSVGYEALMEVAERLKP